MPCIRIGLPTLALMYPTEQHWKPSATRSLLELSPCIHAAGLRRTGVPPVPHLLASALPRMDIHCRQDLAFRSLSRERFGTSLQLALPKTLTATGLCVRLSSPLNSRQGTSELCSTATLQY
jgi:hypothetical protein